MLAVVISDVVAAVVVPADMVVSAVWQNPVIITALHISVAFMIELSEIKTQQQNWYSNNTGQIITACMVIYM